MLPNVEIIDFWKTFLSCSKWFCFVSHEILGVIQYWLVLVAAFSNGRSFLQSCWKKNRGGYTCYVEVNGTGWCAISRSTWLGQVWQKMGLLILKTLAPSAAGCALLLRTLTLCLMRFSKYTVTLKKYISYVICWHRTLFTSSSLCNP